jgi:hypothetical protein
MPVFLDFFGFIAFSGASQRWEFKSTTKNVFHLFFSGVSVFRSDGSFIAFSGVSQRWEFKTPQKNRIEQILLYVRGSLPAPRRWRIPLTVSL